MRKRWPAEPTRASASNSCDGALNDARAAEKSAENDAPIKDRLLYNLARVYAQAVSQFEAEARKASDQDRLTAARRRAMYREKAWGYWAGRWRLCRRIGERRSGRIGVAVDPVFAALRDADPYSRLAGLYAGAKP